MLRQVYVKPPCHKSFFAIREPQTARILDSMLWARLGFEFILSPNLYFNNLGYLIASIDPIMLPRWKYETSASWFVTFTWIFSCGRKIVNIDPRNQFLSLRRQSRLGLRQVLWISTAFMKFRPLLPLHSLLGLMADYRSTWHEKPTRSRSALRQTCL